MRWWILALCWVSQPAWADEPLVLLGELGQPVAVVPAPGQSVLLHFWATWCPTCGSDIVALQRAAASCPVERLEVKIVNVGESEDAIALFVERYGIELPLLRDPKGTVFRDFGGRGLPMNVFWSAEGRTIDVSSHSYAEWQERLARLGCGASS